LQNQPICELLVARVPGYFLPASPSGPGQLFLAAR